jgi:hypothetical protein
MTTSTLDDHDRAALRDIAAVLAKHDRLERFGIYLQHEHFDVDADEAIHEINDTLGRISIRRPIKKDVIPPNAFDTAWALDTSGKVHVTAWCCD